MHEEIQNVKNPAQKPRARGKEKSQVSKYVAKVYKKAAQIADLMSGEDVEADLKVLREAKKATHHIYDTKKKKLVKVPDHKTRLAATTLSRAYHEGKPVERTISVHGDVDDFAAMLEKARQSPAALDWLQKTVEGKEILDMIEDSPREPEPELGEHQ
jgi:ribosomal protein L22